MSVVKGSPAIGRLGMRLYLRHWRKMLFFSVCIAAGVAFLFSVDHLLATIHQGIAGRARELLGGDIGISSSRPFDPKARAVFKRLEKDGVRGVDVISFSSMLETPGSAPFLVSVKAVAPGYPFYGKIVTEPNGVDLQKSEDGPACFIEDSIALQHSVKAGSEVVLGRLRLRVAAILLKEPDRAVTGFSFAPRVLMSLEIAKKSGLLQFGSRIQHQYLIALPPSTDPARAARSMKARLETELDDPYLNITDYTEAEPTLSEALQRVTTFFVLISLVGLLLGSIGMASSISIFLNEELESVGVLRCLGLGPRDIARLYGGLCGVIGIQGGILGIAGGWVLSRVGLLATQRVIGLQIDTSNSIHLASLIQALAISCALTVGINYGKIRALSRVAPLDILRDRVKGLPSSPLFTMAVILIGLPALFCYAWLKADSYQVARDFSLAILGSALLIYFLILPSIEILSVLLAKRRGAIPFHWRHGLLHLTRQRGRTVVFLATMSAGFALLGALGIVHHSLSKEIMLGRAADAPGLFLVDVQKNQARGVTDLASRFSPEGAEFAPLIRARLTDINGMPIAKQEQSGTTMEERSRQRMLLREYNLTYKDSLHPSEKIIAGSFWKPGENSPQISLEEGFAKRTGIKMGDRLRFDIQGRSVEATVTSLRSIDWVSMRPNFFVVMPKAILEKAPQVFVASLRIREGRDSARFRTELLSAFPNISAIDITKMLDSVSSVLDTLLKALEVLACFCVCVGLLVLAGTLSLGQKERRETAGLFRALGSDRGDLIRIDAAEFTAIGILTFFIAAATSYGLGYAVSRRMDIRFSADPLEAMTILALALVLPLGVGLAVNRRAYQGEILENLRRDD